MTEVIPAVLAKGFRDLHDKIARVASVANMVQIDICDGKFVDSISWPMDRDDEQSVKAILDEEEGLPSWDTIDFEFDLMVMNAYENFDFFLKLGPRRVVFHFEAQTDPIKFKEFLEGLDVYTRDSIDIGIAINTTTNIDDIKYIINNIDFIQCMGIEHIGHQGEPFDERVLSQIKAIKSEYPDMIVSVDGSVNEDTASLLVEAGADRIIIGSALTKSFDIRETMRELENL